MKNAATITTVLALSLLGACATVPVDERASLRHTLDEEASELIAMLVTDNPELQRSVDDAEGYFAARISATKVPVLGGAFGIGVLFDKESGSRTYMNATRFDIGAGMGAGRFRVLILFENRQALEQFRTGTWERGAGAVSAAGTHSGSVRRVSADGYLVHVVSEKGAAVALTARATKFSVNHDLTDAGVSELSIPNTGFISVDEQDEDAPRIWDHKLPFLAQQVIDLGYDLPLPYGVGVTYAHVDQKQLLDSLEVGINGRDEQPFEFVGFENARSVSDSVTVMADAWLFPFMNVFAMLGTIDGHAPLDVLLDGNGMLDHLDINCQGFPPDPLCRILEDKTITLPIDADFSGTSYGIGTTLAGGWNNWFVAIPIALTYADMDGSSTEGLVTTIAPRFGRVFNLGRKGNLALFAGGNYLKSALTVSGRVSTPDQLLVIDYTIEQENEDRWNALLGFNWDINKRLSWSAEYDGFIGSRDAFITSINWKY